MDRCEYCNGFGSRTLTGLIDENTGLEVRQRCRECSGTGEAHYSDSGDF